MPCSKTRHPADTVPFLLRAIAILYDRRKNLFTGASVREVISEFVLPTSQGIAKMASNQSVRRLNVGCGRNILPGWINLDAVALPGVDMVADLEKCATNPLPIETDSIDEFLLSHLIEHINNPLPLMQELHRIAKPDSKLVIRCPHGASDDAWEDPTHVRALFAQSFGYFSQPFYWRADYGYRGDWQPAKVIFVVDARTHQGMTVEAIAKQIEAQRNVVREMIAELVAIKPIRQPLRELQSAPPLQFALA
jgi:SAM-dependent methyltransferase